MSADTEHINGKFQRDFEMLKFFHDEYIYHHKHFWQVLFKLSTLSIVVTILPLTSEIFGVKLDEISQGAKFFFPSLGLLTSIFSLIIMLQEANRLRWIGNSKAVVNNDMPKHYRYTQNETRKIKVSLAVLIPWLTFGFELIVISFCFFILFIQTPIT